MNSGQLSLLFEHRPIAAEHPAYTIMDGEECTAFGRDIGWVRVVAYGSSFVVVGGRHNGLCIEREFLYLFHP